MKLEKIAVLTSGGDCPGMNPAIRAVARAAISKGIRVVGVYDGYQGILERRFKNLEWHHVARIIQRGGTILRTARFPEFKEEEVRREAVRVLKEEGIDGLVVIGGDGSLTGAKVLWEGFGFPVIGIPATIDNDIWGTDFSLGTDTALNLGVQALDRLRDTAESHKRVFVVEMFGNQSGYLVVLCGLAAGATHLLVPERPVSEVDLEKLSDRIKWWYVKAGENSNWDEMPRNAMIVISEGAKFLHLPGEPKDNSLKKVMEVRDRLENKLSQVGGDCRVAVLGHTQRGGSPSAFDRILGAKLGAEAVRVLEETKGGYMVGLSGNAFKATRLEEVLSNTLSIQKEPTQNEKLKELIDLQGSIGEATPELPPKEGPNILILTSGADAPGMNMAARAVVRRACRYGWQCFGVDHGFSPLMEGRAGDIFELEWEDVHTGKMVLGGSFLGSKRTEEMSERDLEQVWETINARNISGVVVLGGSHAFSLCQKLMASPQRKPLVFVPATISNNLPGTDMSIGADTCLNTLVSVLDKCKDTGTALKRIQVVQTMGRINGWLAIHTALAGGAETVFDMETGVSLKKLKKVARYLKEAYNRREGEAQKTGIVLLNERAGEIFSAETIRDILAREVEQEVRIVNPGQMQRGGLPSAFDRILGSRLGIEAVEQLRRAFSAKSHSAVLVGWENGESVTHSLEELFQKFNPTIEGIPYLKAERDHELLRILSERPSVSKPLIGYTLEKKGP